MKKIVAHTVAKNEARFVWYAVMSVVDHVDEILLWDTGSTDGTREIMKEIRHLYPSKISFKEVPVHTPQEFTAIRQKMLDATKGDWMLVLDADEIWWDESIEKVVEFIEKEGDKYDSFFVPTINLIGDMYHRQEEAAGRYQIAGKTGHLALRGINMKIPGLSSDKPHGTWGWVDEDKKMVQDRDQKRIKFLDAPYIHTTFLPRAGSLSKDAEVIKRAQKRKHEIGEPLALDYFYPEVFFRPRPDFVEVPWQPMDAQFKLRAKIETPLRKLKRNSMPWKVGY